MIARLSRAWAERRAPPLLRPPDRRGAVAAAAAVAAPTALALLAALVAQGVAQDWREGFGRQATLAAPDEPTFAAAVRVLETSPGVAQVTPLDDGAPDAAGRLAAVTLAEGDALAESGAEGRLAAEAPGAILDLHDAWRGPLLRAATALQAAGWAGAAVAVGAALLLLAQTARLRAGLATSDAPETAQGLAQEARLLVAMGVEPARLASAVARIEGGRALFGGALGAAAVGAAALAALRCAASPQEASEPARLVSPVDIAAAGLGAVALTVAVAAFSAWRAARAALAPADPWAAAPRPPRPRDPAPPACGTPSGASP